MHRALILVQEWQLGGDLLEQIEEIRHPYAPMRGIEKHSGCNPRSLSVGGFDHSLFSGIIPQGRQSSFLCMN